MSDNIGCILILNVTINAKSFVLINLYILNTENNQTLNTILTTMRTIYINENSNFLQAGNFNVFFNTNLGCCGGNPPFEQKSVAKLIGIRETFDSCDVRIIINPKMKWFTLR